VRLYVWWATVFVAAGWILSWCASLNLLGYILALVPGLAGTVILWRADCRRRGAHQWLCRWRTRRRRFLPASYALLVVLALLGALLHPPNMYDSLSYRIPRLLNWFAEDGWHWIENPDVRMNTRVAGTEWVWAAFIQFTNTDRWLFLPNFLSFLFLPSLIFGTFLRMGVRPRVAWNWMWLVPTGYCYLLQAGGIANDSYATVFALGGLCLALDAARTRRALDAWLAILAGALLTSVKTSNLPLLLPIAVALLPSAKVLLRFPLRTATVGTVGLLVSFLPTAALNQKYCGDWMGYVVENHGVERAPTPPGTAPDPPTPGKVFRVREPLVGIAGNVVNASVHNLVPPAFPWAKAWNNNIHRWLPDPWEPVIFRNFEADYLRLGELQTELAGFGMGLSVLVLISWGTAVRWRSRERTDRDWWMLALRWSPFVALAYLFTQCGIGSVGRLLAPYYPLLLPLVLCAPSQSALVRAKFFRHCARGVIALALFALVMLPERPLWPANRLLDGLAQRFPNQASLQRAASVYSVYAERYDAFARLRNVLPPDAKVIGFVGNGDDPEASLWRPFGARRVVALIPANLTAARQRHRLEYIAASSTSVEFLFREPFQEWRRRHELEPVARVTLALKVARGPEEWYLLRARSPSGRPNREPQVP
jgi:hypothetical protein